ncbi:hypothetical protein MYX04_08230 [Nitrospiraceae bacterium AH_259_D15_M11_P09]|nr:hypothetical protein [Nitrospiraceae bacterium AH_259_D15_M11_P09]
MSRVGEETLDRRYWFALAVGVFLLGGSVVILPYDVEARDLMLPKEQEQTEFGDTLSPSLDNQQYGTPKSIFISIQMARNYEVEWESFGRSGWYTQDPLIHPVDPGTTVFTPDTAAIYVVFEVAPLEDPAQFGAQWFLLDEKGNPSSAEPMGQDVLEVPGHSRFGFLEILKPADGDWPVGKYMMEIFITPLGQQPFHAVNEVGTMKFTIAG